MYFVFQNKTPTQTTHQHTYHPRLHNKAIEEYLCDPCHPSLATRPILVLLTSLQSLWHASQEVLQIRISFPRAHISIRCQQLRNRLFELEGGDDFVILQILEFPDGQIFPQLGPHSLDWNQVSTTGWEPHGVFERRGEQKNGFCKPQMALTAKVGFAMTASLEGRMPNNSLQTCWEGLWQACSLQTTSRKTNYAAY